MRLRALSVRKTSGGSVADRASGQGRLAITHGQGDLLILVHGFNVSEDEAVASYRRYFIRLEGRVLAQTLDVVAFHWPGDRPERPRIMSALSYSDRIEAAGRAGDRLGELLGDVRPDRRVVIVAHSLGCRLTLAALKWAQLRASRPRLSLVVLMAAAVPTAMCVPGNHEDFGDRYPGTYYANLRSERDNVLRALVHGRVGIFDSGQWIFHPKEAGPAVGFKGGPPGRWDSEIRTTLGHGDYWTSDEAIDAVASTVGLLRPVRSMPKHHLPYRELHSWK